MTARSERAPAAGDTTALRICVQQAASALAPLAPAPENPILSASYSQPVEAGNNRSAKAALGLANRSI